MKIFLGVLAIVIFWVGIFFARNSFTSKKTRQKLAATFWGANPHIIPFLVRQHNSAIVGFVLYALASTIQIIALFL